MRAWAGLLTCRILPTQQTMPHPLQSRQLAAATVKELIGGRSFLGALAPMELVLASYQGSATQAWKIFSRCSIGLQTLSPVAKVAR